MADLIYPRTGGAYVDGDRFTVLGGRPGPAGTSSATLANGDIWQVDHADPSRLVALESDVSEPVSSPLLLAAIGGDELLFLMDAAAEADDVEWDETKFDVPGSRPRVRSWGGAARSAGESIVLADLAVDGRLHPLARIAAAVELAVSLPASPVESLLAPVATTLLDQAHRLADQFDDDDLDLIDPKDLAVLRSLLQQLERTHLLDAGWSQLAERLRTNLPMPRLALAATITDAAFRSDDVWHGRDEMRKTPTIDGPHELLRIDEAVVEVAVARADRERWVRVLQRAGLILVGQAPLRREGLADKAEVVIPADLTDDELEFEVVDADDLTSPPERPIDRVRAAITAGRDAARADRANDPSRSRPRWHRCAELWRLAGDHRRGDLARRLAETGGVSAGWQPVADRLAEAIPGTA